MKKGLNFLDKKGKYLGISSNDLIKSKSGLRNKGFFSFLGPISSRNKNSNFSTCWYRTNAIKKISDLDYIWQLNMGRITYLCRLSFWRNYLIIETYLDQIKFVVKPILILIFLYFLLKLLLRLIKKIDFRKEFH